MRGVGGSTLLVGVKRGQGTKGKETQNLASVSEENERTSLLLREILFKVVPERLYMCLLKKGIIALAVSLKPNHR